MSEIVTIIREGRVPMPAGPGAVREMVEIVYQAPGQFPRSVYLDPSHDTPEERIRVISEDLKQAREFVASTLEIS